MNPTLPLLYQVQPNQLFPFVTVASDMAAIGPCAFAVEESFVQTFWGRLGSPQSRGIGALTDTMFWRYFIWSMTLEEFSKSPMTTVTTREIWKVNPVIVHKLLILAILTWLKERGFSTADALIMLSVSFELRSPRGVLALLRRLRIIIPMGMQQESTDMTGY